MFAARLLCVMTTPFGVAVEPEVNWTKAMSSADGVRGASIEGPCSESNGTTVDRSGHDVRNASMWGINAAEVITPRALQERSTRAVASRYARKSEVGPGG